MPVLSYSRTICFALTLTAISCCFLHTPLYAADVACGPRCAVYVLNHFGIEADFEDIAANLLPLDKTQGADLASLANLLESQGLFVKGLRTSHSKEISWPEPVIVHLEADKEGIGHFVVLCPSDTPGIVRIWNGLSGIEEGSYEDLSRMMSGYVLLTSKQPIDNGALLSKSNDVSSQYYDRILSILAVCLNTTLLALLLFRRRTA